MSYTWTDAEQSGLKYEEGDTTLFIPADPANRHYAEYLASGETASAYVAPPAPPAPPEPTAAEKLEARTGLTIAEIKTVLGI